MKNKINFSNSVRNDNIFQGRNNEVIIMRTPFDTNTSMSTYTDRPY